MNKEYIIQMLKRYNPSSELEMEYRRQILDFLYRNEIFAGKGNPQGHLTGSAWIVNQEKSRVLLAHHRKLSKWLQLGGHVDMGEDIIHAALREAREESGMVSLQPLMEGIFDIDVHRIPQYLYEKEHFHYDIRILLVGDEDEPLVLSSESKDLRWIDLEDAANFTLEKSIHRMVEKTYEMKRKV